MAHIDVPLTTLDALLPTLNLDYTHTIIKMDVEGHEPSVIRGAQTFIHQHTPTMLIEVARGRTSEQWQPLFTDFDALYGATAVFGNAGMRHFDIPSSALAWSLKQRGLSNILFTPRRTSPPAPITGPTPSTTTSAPLGE